MILENLYRVFFDKQTIVLEDARTQNILWRGIMHNIPLKYLDYNVMTVMSRAVTKTISEIVIIIA